MMMMAIKFVIYLYAGSTVMAIPTQMQGDSKINTKAGKKRHRLQLTSLNLNKE